MIDIRDATEGDLPRILDITNQAIAHSTSVWNETPATPATRHAWFDERMQRSFPVLVAVADGDVVGFGSFGDFRAWEGYRHTVEHSLYVDPPAQGRGAGKALLRALVDRAVALDKHVIVGGIESGNSISLALHRREGFVETGRMPEVGQKFGRWLDLVLVQRIL